MWVFIGFVIIRYYCVLGLCCGEVVSFVCIYNILWIENWNGVKFGWFFWLREVEMIIFSEEEVG